MARLGASNRFTELFTYGCHTTPILASDSFMRWYSSTRLYTTRARAATHTLHGSGRVTEGLGLSHTIRSDDRSFL